ncbi:MAG: DUF4173 domain-containing protein [Gemmatimonadales bacterium]
MGTSERLGPFPRADQLPDGRLFGLPRSITALDRQLAVRTMAAAAALGFAGDHVFRASPWGLSVAVWLVALVAFTAALVHERDRRLTRAFTALLSLAVFFAGCVAWRDAPMLAVWNVLGTLLCLALAGLAASHAHLPSTPLAVYVRQPVRTALNVVLGPVALAQDGVDWRAMLDARRFSTVGAIGLGLVVSTPLVLVFGGLLGSADPVFERFLHSLVDWNVSRILGHLALFGVAGWLAAGLIRSVLARPATQTRRLPWDIPFGLIELAIPLGLLAALFLAFDVVQVRYLFGGDDLIRSTVGLTYAEYARRGFFELVAVSVLMLPVLLSADWCAAHRDARTRRVVRALTIVLLALVGLIMTSAMLRMRLYVEVYGLSLDRIYASAVMMWIAATLLWFALTVLRARRDRFGFGTIVAGLAVLVGLNLANPDALVARVNIERAAAGVQLDVAYLGTLSADATPTLLGALDRLDGGVACAVFEHLQRNRMHWSRSNDDWRSWNHARASAVAAVRHDTPSDCSPDS